MTPATDVRAVTAEPIAPELLPASPSRQQNCVSLRAVLLGLGMVVVIIGLTQVMSIRSMAAEVGGNAPPPAPLYLLLAYVLVAPLLARLHPRLGLTRGELVLIYGMMLVAGAICHPYAIGFLVPHTVAPLYFGRESPSWSVFAPALPSWLGPTDSSAINQFFAGGDGSVPWLAWVIPLLAWSSLLLALFWVMLCLNVLLRRQWVEHERLTFPLASIPLALSNDAERHLPGEGSRSSLNLLASSSGIQGVTRAPLFWFGILLTLLVRAPSSVHRYVPALPDLPLRDLPLVDGTLLPAPWSGVGLIEIDVIPWLIGVAYLLPKEITFSACFFYAVRLLEDVSAVWGGTTGTAPSVYSNEYPALFAQGAGAAFALTAITLWAARRHLASILRHAVGLKSNVEDREEFLSYRVAFWGAVLGTFFLLGWLWVAGMRLWVAALLLLFMLSYFFLFARIRAETGLGMGVILWPKMLDEVMITVVGSRFLSMRDLTILYALRWLYFGPAIGSVMACQLEGLKLTEAGGLRGQRVGWTLALTALVATPLAFLWTLHTFYGNGGFEAMPVGQRATSMVGSQIYWSYQNLANTLADTALTDWGGVAAMGAGAAVTIGLSALRARFLWFPLHPVGYLAANSWGIHINWFSLLAGWLLNVLLTRYGGLTIYRRVLPMFLGFIVGDMLHQGLWGLVAWGTGGRTL